MEENIIEIRLSETKKRHRDIILIFIVGENYKDVYESHIGAPSGSKGVANYFVDLVDRLLSNGEYQEAVNYATELVLDGKENINNIGGLIWVYLDKKYNNSLDWYYAEKAKSEIEREINEFYLKS